MQVELRVSYIGVAKFLEAATLIDKIRNLNRTFAAKTNVWVIMEENNTTLSIVVIIRQLRKAKGIGVPFSLYFPLWVRWMT